MSPRLSSSPWWAAGLAALLAAGPSFATDPAAAAAPAPQALSNAALRAALDAMPQGSAQRGQTAYAQLQCAGCHGEKGQAPTLNWPHLAGQRAGYTYKLLLDYQQGRRHEGQRAAVMADAVQGVSPQTLADVSVWLASLPTQPDPLSRGSGLGPAASTAVTPAAITQLVRHGDPKRLITACASCHGVSGQGGGKASAGLAGQNPAYLVRTLLDYQQGLRRNDTDRGMRHFAAKLTRAEIDALAQYYAALPLKP